MRLEGKRTLVTGGGGGIGRGIAKRFAAEGAGVAIVDIDGDAAADMAGNIAASGGRAISIRCDVSDPADVERMVHDAVAQLDGLDVAVANAAVMDRTPILETTPEIFERVTGVSFRGSYFTTVHAARAMRHGGVIIHVTSVEDDRGVLSSGAPYTMAKGGTRALVSAGAVQLGAHGIRVVGLAPGMVPTGLNEGRPRGDLRSIPAGRLGTVDDMAGAAVFLASDDAAYVNGSTLYVDGGWLSALV